MARPDRSAPAASRQRRLGAAVLALAVLTPALASAQTTPPTDAATVAPQATPLGQFEGWSAFQATENGETFCFMTAQPTSKEPSQLDHGDVILYITHRPSEGTSNVVSLITGYPFRQDSEVQVSTGRSSASLFTRDNSAWAYDRATDQRLVEAMRRGATLSVRGTSRRGNGTRYAFSLMGFTAAHDEISRACGLQQ